MKKTFYKYIFVLVLLCVASAPLFSIDYTYGVDIETSDALGIYYSNQRRVTPWFDIAFPEIGGWSVQGQASAIVRFNPKYDLYRPIFDLDLLRVRTPILPFCYGSAQFEIGRITVQDTRGLIMHQKADGIALHISIPRIIMDLSVTYTGLLNYYTSPIMLSKDDITEVSEKMDKYYGKAARRLVGQWSTIFPQFIGRADVHGDLIGQIDLRQKLQDWKIEEEKEVLELVDSAYFALGINGPFANSNKWYYNADLVVEGLMRRTKSKTHSFAGFYAEAGVQFFPKHNMLLELGVQYGTPEKEGISSYRPITYMAAGNSYAGGYNDLIKPALSFKWKPNSRFTFDTSIASFITPYKVEKLDKAGWEKNYRYTEFSIGGTGVIAEDLRLRLDLSYGYGFSNISVKEKEFDLALRLKCNISL